MRLSPAHAVVALKARRPAVPHGASPDLPAGAMHFLPLALASMIPGSAPTSLAEIRDRRTQRDDAIQTRYESAATDGAAPSATQQLQRDERELKTGSRAATRQAGMELAREKFQSARDAFRNALSQARSGGRPEPSGDPAQLRPLASTSPGAVAAQEHAGSPVSAMPDAAKAIASIRPSNSSQMDAGTAPQAAPSAAPPPVASAPPPTVASAPQLTSGAASGSVATLESASQAMKAVAAAAASSTGAPANDRSPLQPAANAGDRPLSASSREPKPAAAGDADSAAPRENIDRILRVLRGQILRNKSTTVIRMDPPELGYLRLQLDLHKDGLRLRIDADSQAARQMLSGELDTLRQGLDAAGIRLETVDIRPLTPVDGSTAQHGQMPAWQDASAGSHREASRESHSRTEREAAASSEATDAAVAVDGLQGVFAKDSRVNLVV